jgi:hypothetical protein
MYGTTRLLGSLAIVALVSACDGSTTGLDLDEDGDDRPAAGKVITTSAEATQVFLMLKSAGEAVNRGVATNFVGPVTVVGAEGRASVTGRKTASNTSTSTSQTTRRMSDLQIAFADFKATGGVLKVNGNMRWFDNYYSRMACSSTTCASSSDHSESMEGRSIQVEFMLNGQRYSDEITVDVDSPDYTSRWSGKIVNRLGQSISVSF